MDQNPLIDKWTDVPRGYNTMANGGQIMRFKLDSNEILLYN